MDSCQELRLRKILTTLLIDYSEDEIEATLARIPSQYKKVSRKHYDLTPPQETTVHIKIKGIDYARPETKRDKGFRNNSLIW